MPQQSAISDVTPVCPGLKIRVGTNKKQKSIYTRGFLAALFVITKTGNNPNAHP